MSRISNTGSTGSTSTTNSSNSQVNDLGQVDISQFMNLMITQLQNQDPLAPTDNAQLLQQIGTMTQITSSNSLTDSLKNFSNGQQLTMASDLIGKKVSALDDKASQVDGIVDRVSVEVDSKDRNKRTVKVHIGESTVDINNIREIVQPSAT